MYKHRISKWGLKKNFRLEELEAVASTLGHFVQAGLNPPTAMIDNRKVPIERAKRHFKASFLCGDQLSSGGKLAPPKESSRRDSRAICVKRTTQTTLGLQRRSQAVPRVLLKQSTESHLLESTLATVNNYYAWRLGQSDEYFAVPKHGLGEHTVISDELDPVDVFSLMREGLAAAVAGAYQLAQSLMRRFCSQAPVLLLQQRPSLLENLLYSLVYPYEEGCLQFQSSIISYLAALASRLFKHDHPVSMILKLVRYYEARKKGCQLIFRLMCEIATRQKDQNAGIIFELEFDMAKVSIHYDDFHAAAEFCQALLQRYVDKLDERHKFSRRLLILLGELYWKHDLYDEPERILLRVLELDDSYARDARKADSISAQALEFLGLRCEKREDWSGAEKWYRQAYEATCSQYGVDDGTARFYLSILKSVRRRLSETDDVGDEDQIDEADVLEEIRIKTTRLDLEGVPTEADFETRTTAWNEWQADIQDANDSSHPSGNGRAIEDDISSTSQEEGSHQRSRSAESQDASNDIPVDGESAWDAAHAPSKEHEREHHLGSSPQCLEGPANGTAFDTFNEMDVAFHLPAYSAADSYISATEPPFAASELASDAAPQAINAPKTHSLLSKGPDPTTAEQYIDPLPPLETGPEFDEFDNVKANDMTEFAQTMLDTDDNANVFNPGFFDCFDLQDWHALEGHDTANDQDPDIDWGDLLIFEQDQGGM
jgi:tetratricopeptide (TPR) repeat protein